MNTQLQKQTTGLQAVAADVSKYFVKRDDLLLVTAVAMIAEEHVFMPGPPGSAKTDVSKELACRITDAKVFVTQGTEEMPSTNITGPYNLPKLLNQGVEEFNTDGYAYDAHYAVFDEYGRFAGGSLNVVLGLLNKDIVKNGNQLLLCVLKTVFATSNTKLTGTHEANLDRFLLFYRSSYLETEADMRELVAIKIRHHVRKVGATISLAEIEAMHAQIPIVMANTDQGIWDKLIAIVRRLRADGVKISDRRWPKAMIAIAAHAIYENRNRCTDDDLFILNYIFGHENEEDEVKVRRAISEIANPLKMQITSRLDEATTMHRSYFEMKEKAQSPEDKTAARNKGEEYDTKIGEIVNEMQEIVNNNPGNAQAAKIQAEIEKLHEDLIRRGLMSGRFKGLKF